MYTKGNHDMRSHSAPGAAGGGGPERAPAGGAGAGLAGMGAGIDRVLVLNMARNPERWFDTLHRLERAGVPRASVTRVPGVDGNSPEHKAFFEREYPARRKAPDARYPRLTRDCSCGEVAHTRSFLRLLDLWRGHTEWDTVLVLEDKALPCKDLPAAVRALCERNGARLRDCWAVQLGGTQHSWEWPQARAIEDGLYPGGSTDGTFALLLRRAFLEPFAAQLGVFQGATDSGGVRLLAVQHPGRVWVAFPNLVACDVAQSELGHGRDLREHAEKMRWDMDRYITERDTGADRRATVVMTYFDSPSTVAMAVDSYRSQKYHNMELILVDDASERPPELSEAALADPRVRVERLSENRGTYYAKCHGLRLATGRYLFFADSDDFARPFRLSQQVGALLWLRPAPLVVSGPWIRDSRPAFDDTTALTAYFENRKDRLGRDKYEVSEVPALITQGFTRETLYRLLSASEPHCRPFDTLTRHSADAEITERLLAIEFGKVMNPYDHLNVLLRRGGRPELGVVYDSSTALLYATSPPTSLTNTLRVNTDERLQYRRAYLRRHWDLYGYVPLFDAEDRAAGPRSRRVRAVDGEVAPFYQIADPPVFGRRVTAATSNERIWRLATMLRARNEEVSKEGEGVVLGVLVDSEGLVTEVSALETAWSDGSAMLVSHLAVPSPWRRSLNVRVPVALRGLWSRLFAASPLPRDVFVNAAVDHRCGGFLIETVPEAGAAGGDGGAR